MKNVLVTGSTGTLGEEILRLLLKNNYNVIGLYNKNWERAYELEKELGIEFIKCDFLFQIILNIFPSLNIPYPFPPSVMRLAGSRN